MKREEIIEKLREILLAADSRHADAVSSYTEESKLIGDIGLSSVSLLYVVIAIEEEFGIRFDDASPSDFETLGDVVGFIGERLS